MAALTFAPTARNVAGATKLAEPPRYLMVTPRLSRPVLGRIDIQR